MAALTTGRNTIQMGDRAHADLLYVPMKAATTVFQGSLVCIDAGFAAPARTATGLVVMGRAELTVLNPGASGATFVTIRRGVFKWVNADIVAADLGLTAWANDDQTVSHTLTAKSVAGKILQIDSDGVWIETFGAITAF